VFVTHDQDEALELADRIVVLRDGRIEQVGTPHEVYDAPASAWVFGFVGRAGVLDGRVERGQFVADGTSLALPAPDTGDGAAALHARPHHFELVAPTQGIRAHVAAAHRLADRVTLELQVPGQTRTLELDLVATADVAVPAIGSEIGVRPARYRVYAAD